MSKIGSTVATIGETNYELRADMFAWERAEKMLGRFWNEIYAAAKSRQPTITEVSSLFCAFQVVSKGEARLIPAQVVDGIGDFAGMLELHKQIIEAIDAAMPTLTDRLVEKKAAEGASEKPADPQ